MHGIARRVLTAVLLAGPLAYAVAQPTGDVALRAERLFDARAGVVKSPGVVVVSKGRIVSVGGSVPAGVRVIELGDMTLLPGLIDAHTHLTDWRAENVLAKIMSSDAHRALVAAGNARKTLDAGFTTVRDLWSIRRADVELRDAIARGDVPGPRIVASAIALGARGGHCEQTLPDLDALPGLEGGVAVGADGFRDAVRHAVKRGADVIKVCVSSGVSDAALRPDTVQLTKAEIDAVVDEAHRQGRKVAVHSHSDAGARLALEAGADSIEHGTFLTDSTLDLLTQRGAFLVPDLAAAEYWNGTLGERVGQSPGEIAKADAAYAPFIAMVKRAIARKVPIAFGTDAGEYPHGMNGLQFAMLVQHGMTPARALQSATVVAAELLGLEDEIGRLDAGMAADIVAVRGDPLRDIDTMSRVTFVMQQGQVVRHEAPGLAPAE